MSNKAIDKTYLQQQFVNFNRDVINKRYITKLSAIPTGKIASPTTAGYSYDADQYSLYNNNIFQWVGADNYDDFTPTGESTAVNLRTGYFYKIVMEGESQENPTAWAITGIINQKVQDATDLDAGNGIIIDETDPNNPTISANIGTNNTYNNDISISTGSTASGTAITIDDWSRVNDSQTMLDIASGIAYVAESGPSDDDGSGSDSDGESQEEAVTYTASTGTHTWAVKDIVTYIGDDFTYTGEGDNYVPDGLVTGHQYQLTNDDINEIVVWKEIAPITINTSYNENNNLAYDHNGLVDLSHIDENGLAAALTTPPAQFVEGFIFQYVGSDTTISAPDDQGVTETLNIYEGRFYKVYETGYGLSLQEIGSQKEESYTIGETTTPATGYLKTYQLYKSVDGGTPEAVAGSVINIPKDFLVKSASVRTYTATGGFWYLGLWYQYNSTNDSFINGTTELYLNTTDYTVTTGHITAFGSTWPKAVYDDSSRTNTIGSVASGDCVIAWESGEGSGNVEGKKYIDFVINTKDSQQGTATNEHIYLALDDLIQTYTAGAGISISTDNKISINFQYTTLPTYSSSLPPAIQYIGTDDVTNSNADPTSLQTGGFYQWNSTTSKWVLINTAKENVDIDFELTDFS